MIRLALIGCGDHAETAHAGPLHLYALRRPDLLQLIACCDIRLNRAEEFCRRFGFARAYSHWEEMLFEESPDAVVCAVPMEQTVPLGTALLRRGTPCVLEKPPGATPQEVAALVAVARETKTPHLISVNRRFNPYLNEALTWTNEAGPLRYIHARMLRHNRREQDFVWGTGVHVIDALRYIGGEWEILDVRVIQPPETASRWYIVSLKFTSGCLGTLEIAPTAGMVEETYDLYGNGFRASVTTLGGMGEGAGFWREGRREREAYPAREVPVWMRDGSYEETVAFLEAVQQGVTPRPTVEDIAPSMDLCARISAALTVEDKRWWRDSDDHSRVSIS